MHYLTDGENILLHSLWWMSKKFQFPPAFIILVILAEMVFLGLIIFYGNSFENFVTKYLDFFFFFFDEF